MRPPPTPSPPATRNDDGWLAAGRYIPSLRSAASPPKTRHIHVHASLRPGIAGTRVAYGSLDTTCDHIRTPPTPPHTPAPPPSTNFPGRRRGGEARHACPRLLPRPLEDAAILRLGRKKQPIPHGLRAVEGVPDIDGVVCGDNDNHSSRGSSRSWRGGGGGSGVVLPSAGGAPAGQQVCSERG